MPWDVILTAALIALARIADVALGTLRMVAVMRGRREVASSLGFIEVLIWVVAVSKVITNLDNPVYAVAFAFGFSAGSYVGMTIERWLAHGEQVLRVFTRIGDELAEGLRAEGHRVTQFEGKGRAGPVSLLFIKAPRKAVGGLMDKATALDPDCFMTVEDIRHSSTMELRMKPGFRGIAKKK